MAGTDEHLLGKVQWKGGNGFILFEWLQHHKMSGEMAVDTHEDNTVTKLLLHVA